MRICKKASLCIAIFSTTTVSVADPGLGLGPANNSSAAWSTSFSGRITVGMAFVPGPDGHAFLWDRQTGAHDLGSLLDTSIAWGVSPDGTVAVGYSGLRGDKFATTWEDGKALPVVFPFMEYFSEVKAASWWGETIVGTVIESDGEPPRAYRMAGGKYEDLGVLPGTDWSEGRDVSGDGRVVVGLSQRRGFRWEDGVLLDLGTLPGDDNSEAEAISLDGLVIVGWSGSVGEAKRGFRWIDGQLNELPRLAGFDGLIPKDVSGDGTVVVGLTDGEDFQEQESFVWTSQRGTKLLNDAAEDVYGFDIFAGWDRLVALGVSGDGTTAVGTGINPDGDREAWRVFIPAPGTLGLLCWAAICSPRRRRLSWSDAASA